MAKLQEYTEEEYLQDDALDDFKPPIPPKPAAPVVNGTCDPNSASVGSTTMTIPIELSDRLASIDANLARIADVLERLAGMSFGMTR